MMGAERRLEAIGGPAESGCHHARVGVDDVELAAVGDKAVGGGADTGERGEVEGDQLEAAAAGLRGLAHFTGRAFGFRSEEHTSELQSLMRISYAVFCLKKKRNK